MRLAVVSSGSFPVLDGVTVSVEARLAGARCRGHETLLLAPSTGEAAPPDGYMSFASQPWGAVGGDRNATRAAVAQIDSALARFRPDLIHVEEPERLYAGLWQTPALAFAQANHIPIAAFYHTNFVDYAEDFWPQAPKPALRLGQRFAWRAVMALYNRFDATLLPSHTTYARLRVKGLRNGLCGPFNGADIAMFTPRLRRADFWKDVWSLPEFDRATVILVLGRLTPDKGWAFWKLALTALMTRLGRRVALAIAGEGVLRPQVEQLMASNGVLGRVLGPVPRQHVAGLLANADLYATASTRENASLAVLEALAAGTPVVAPRAGGIPDQVEHGTTGCLFESGSVPDFVSEVADLVDDPVRLGSMRAATLRRRDSLDWERATDAWLAALDTVAERYRQGRPSARS